MTSNKPSLKSRIGEALLNGFLGSMARLPYGVLYVLSDCCYALLYYVLRYRRKVIDANLLLAFPEASHQQRKAWRKAFCHHLCDVVVETIKLLHVTDQQVAKRVKVENAELVDEIARNGHPIVTFLGHYGNWELETFVTRFYSRDIHTAHIYKPLHNQAFDRFMLRLRSRFDSESVSQHAAVRRLLQIHREGCFLLGVIGDHRPNSSDTNHHTLFFGREVTFNVGGETIGRKCKAEFLYLDVQRTSRGHYTLSFQRIVPKDTTVDFPFTTEYYRLMEQTIRRDPPYWLWSHRRWKTIVK